MVKGQPMYGGKLPDVNGLHWRGDESWGHFEDEEGRVKILNVEPPPFIRTSRPV